MPDRSGVPEGCAVGGDDEFWTNCTPDAGAREITRRAAATTNLREFGRVLRNSKRPSFAQLLEACGWVQRREQLHQWRRGSKVDQSFRVSHTRTLPSSHTAAVREKPLEIGTPNKVKVSGASSVLDDLYKIMKILTLAVALVSAPSPTGSGDLGAGGARTRVEQNVVVNPPSYSPENPSITILDLHKALNENIAMKRDLDRALANGEMPLHAYLQEIAKLDAMYKELTEAMKVTRARPGNT